MLRIVPLASVLFCVVFAERRPVLISDKVLKSKNGHGTLKPLKNAHLLQLNGNPSERGYAHGFLLANQIIDWVYFYQFQYNMHGNASYYNEYSKWIVENQFLPIDYNEEARGIIQGMKDSEASMEFNGLGRDFDERDIYVINSYLEGTPNTGARGNGPYTSLKPTNLGKTNLITRRLFCVK